jgi:hypothetical protein
MAEFIAVKWLTIVQNDGATMKKMTESHGDGCSRGWLPRSWPCQLGRTAWPRTDTRKKACAGAGSEGRAWLVGSARWSGPGDV